MPKIRLQSARWVDMLVDTPLLEELYAKDADRTLAFLPDSGITGACVAPQ